MDPHRQQPPTERTFRERLRALENVGPLLRMVWGTSRALTIASVAGRLVRSVMPLATLWVGKLIIDAVAHGVHRDRVWTLVTLEIALAVSSDLLGRAVSLVDSLL